MRMFNFYESDDLIIGGQLYITPFLGDTPKKYADVTYTLRVNGKLIQHKSSYLLIKDPDITENGYTFKDWNEIYRDLAWLSSMQYVNTDEISMFWGGNISSFLNEINNNIDEPSL